MSLPSASLLFVPPVRIPRNLTNFYRRRPRLWQCLHPAVQVKTCGGNRTFGVNRPTAVLHAVADRPLVNIQPDVIHSLDGGASLVSLNQLAR